MILKKITLKNFRNYENLDLEFEKKINIFIGNNAQGKTNILESIYVLAVTKSHRTSKDLFLHTYKALTPISVMTQGFCLKSDYVRVDRDIAKQHFGIPRNAIVFLYYGTIRPSKGLDILIEAIHLAHDRNKRVYLLAAGAFHKVNEDEMKALVKSELKDEYATVNFGFVLVLKISEVIA